MLGRLDFDVFAIPPIPAATFLQNLYFRVLGSRDFWGHQSNKRTNATFSIAASRYSYFESIYRHGATSKSKRSHSLSLEAQYRFDSVLDRRATYAKQSCSQSRFFLGSELG
jgi:hypothetical protein